MAGGCAEPVGLILGVSLSLQSGEKNTAHIKSLYVDRAIAFTTTLPCKVSPKKVTLQFWIGEGKHRRTTLNYPYRQSVVTNRQKRQMVENLSAKPENSLS